MLGVRSKRIVSQDTVDHDFYDMDTLAPLLIWDALNFLTFIPYNVIANLFRSLGPFTSLSICHYQPIYCLSTILNLESRDLLSLNRPSDS